MLLRTGYILCRFQLKTKMYDALLGLLPRCNSSKEPTYQCRRHKRCKFNPWVKAGIDPLEEGRATHSSLLAWGIPWTEEPGGLQSYSPWSHKELDLTDVT